jgi:F-type H+-transporting ATPase subunit c
MKKKLMLIFLVVLITIPMFSTSVEKYKVNADEEKIVQAVDNPTNLFMWSIIIGGLALALAASAGAIAQSKAFQVAAESIGRNPASTDSIRGILIIALALIESLVIYVLLIDLIIFFVKWGSYTNVINK